MSVEHAATSRARVSALTDVGRTREHNEDAFLVADLAVAEPLEFPAIVPDTIARTADAPNATAPNASAPSANATGVYPAERTCDLSGAGVLLLVADGLGGAAAGEVASHLAARVAFDTLRRALPTIDAGTQDPHVIAAALRDAVLAANDAVHQLGSERVELHGMASTITAAYLRDDGITVAQVGDSRAYVVRRGEARQITKDQSLVQRLVDAGEMTPEQAETSVRRNIILQALGPEASVRVDVTRQTLCRDDLVLLCSDGLSGQLRADELGAFATRTPEPGALCAALVAAANASGGPDNITVIAARVSGGAFASSAGDPDDTGEADDCEDVAPHRISVEPITDEILVYPDPAPRDAGSDVPLAGTSAAVRVAPGVSQGVVASRQGRVRGVYALLVAAAIAAVAYTWWAFAR